MKQKNKFKKENESNKGASIVLALYFLLISTVLSSLIILAGSVSAGSITNKVELNKSENIVVSCFKKISDELSGKVFEYRTNEGTSYFEQSVRCEGVILLSSYVSDAFEEVNNAGDYKKDFEIKLENMATKVSGTFSMNKDYEIEIILNQVVINNDEELATKERSIRIYPLSVSNENKTITIKTGEAELI